MLGSDDDEPWDAEVALRNYLADALGAKPAEVLVHGLSRLTPWDISGRVGLDRLLLPDVQEGLEGQRYAEAWTTAALGPVAGIGVNVLKGLSAIADGDAQRGLEAMLPAALRGPAKALRLTQEGAKDRTGVQLVDEVTGAEAAGQFFGFSPGRVREATQAKSAIYNADRRLNERRADLMGQFARARMAGDAEAQAEARVAIRRFNDANPARRIGGEHLAASVRARLRRIHQAEQGVYLSRSRRDALEAGRFAGQ